MKFLSAKWEHLVMANYVVDPQLLQTYVPAGTLIDAFERQRICESRRIHF